MVLDRVAEQLLRHVPGWGRPTERMVGLCLVVLGVAAFTLTALGRYGGASASEASAVVLLLALLTGSAGSAAALLCVFAARLVGESRTTWLGLTLAWYCLVVLPLTTAQLLVVEDVPVLDAARVLVQISTVLLLLVLLRAPEPPSVVGVLGRAVAALAVLGAGTVGLGLGAPELTERVADGAPIGLILALTWFAAGLVVTATRPTMAHVAIGTGLGLLGTVQLWRAVTPSSDLASLGPTVAAMAVLVVLGGSISLVRNALVELDREQAAQEQELREAEAQVARTHERDHELRNGLAGLAGATRLLGRDELIGRAVASELTRLGGMLDSDFAPEPMTAYAVAPVIDGLAALRLGAGRVVDVALPPGVWAVGCSRTLAAVVTNVLANCERHAPGSAVEITAECRPGVVVVRIRDHGPGVEPGREEAVFEAGVRDPDAGGRGLGLPLSRALLEAEGGAVHIEPADPERPGCVVVVELPAAPTVVRLPQATADTIRSSRAS